MIAVPVEELARLWDIWGEDYDAYFDTLELGEEVLSFASWLQAMGRLPAVNTDTK
jgi:hypothetical protein